MAYFLLIKTSFHQIEIVAAILDKHPIYPCYRLKHWSTYLEDKILYGICFELILFSTIMKKDEKNMKTEQNSQTQCHNWDVIMYNNLGANWKSGHTHTNYTEKESRK